MAMPSAVTLGSLAFVVVAGVGLAVVVTQSDDDTLPTASGTETPSKPQASAQAKEHEHEPKTRRHHRPDDVIPKTLVDVYNNSGITGLAADRASFLQGAGWNVAATDNWYGDIPADTVYYPPKLRADATTLAKALGYTRLRPAVSPMQFDRLTVIITTGS
jgi:hypothetical protein